MLSDVTQGERERAEHGPGKIGTGQDVGPGKTWDRARHGPQRRGNKFLRCGAETPSFDLRRKRLAHIYLSCPGEGRDWALRPTAQEFIPTLLSGFLSFVAHTSLAHPLFLPQESRQSEKLVAPAQLLW